MTNVRTTEPRQRLKVHLPPESRRWLRAEAMRRGCSVTQVLRDLVAAEMARRRQG